VPDEVLFEWQDKIFNRQGLSSVSEHSGDIVAIESGADRQIRLLSGTGPRGGHDATSRSR
jgi:hypothetical protein